MMTSAAGTIRSFLTVCCMKTDTASSYHVVHCSLFDHCVYVCVSIFHTVHFCKVDLYKPLEKLRQDQHCSSPDFIACESGLVVKWGKCITRSVSATIGFNFFFLSHPGIHSMVIYIKKADFYQKAEPYSQDMYFKLSQTVQYITDEA